MLIARSDLKHSAKMVSSAVDIFCRTITDLKSQKLLEEWLSFGQASPRDEDAVSPVAGPELVLRVPKLDLEFSLERSSMRTPTRFRIKDAVVKVILVFCTNYLSIT